MTLQKRAVISDLLWGFLFFTILNTCVCDFTLCMPIPSFARSGVSLMPPNAGI